MTKHANEPRHARRGFWKPSDGLVRLALLFGVIVLIVIAAMNLVETRRQRTELNDRLTQLLAATNAKPAPAATPRTGPDPDKVYTVKVDGAPAIGPKGAPITIAEFSDFQ